jgi:hypothetical protein
MKNDETKTTFDFHGDVIDVSTLTDYIDNNLGPDEDEEDEGDDETRAQVALVKSVLEDLCGYGGDHKWEGDWYPGSLIADDYFERYAQDLADDIGAIDRNASWPTNWIDWEKAALELRVDYSSVEIDGKTYWYR